MKYYFITYEATNRTGNVVSKWNQVINVSPMEFIKRTIKNEVDLGNKRTFYDFIVLNTCEISEEDFVKFDGEF